MIGQVGWRSLFWGTGQVGWRSFEGFDNGQVGRRSFGRLDRWGGGVLGDWTDGVEEFWGLNRRKE